MPNKITSLTVGDILSNKRKISDAPKGTLWRVTHVGELDGILTGACKTTPEFAGKQHGFFDEVNTMEELLRSFNQDFNKEK